MKDEKYLEGAIIVRPDQSGTFDELLMMDGSACTVHLEMMEPGSRYIGLYPKDRPGEQMQVRVKVESGKLNASYESS